MFFYISRCNFGRKTTKRHITFNFLNSIIFLSYITQVRGFCGDSIKWSHNVNIEDAYGMWYGVGYAQHTPDLTNNPKQVGCLTLFITDASTESYNDWRYWSINKRNDSNLGRRTYNNPWPDTPTSGYLLDRPIARKRRDIYNERRIRVLWDEDAQSMEQIYLYSPEEPGIWVADQLNSLERKLKAQGVELWYPDQPPKHPQVIRILKASPDSLIISHCSDQGNAGIFSLILRRSPTEIRRQEWYDIKKQLFNFELPNIVRFTVVCAGCVDKCSLIVLLLCILWSFLGIIL